MNTIHHVHDFKFLAMFFDDAGKWVGKRISGLDIETEVVDLPDGRRSGINPHDGDVATVQIENNGEVWVVQVPPGSYLAGLDGAYFFRKYLESPDVTKIIHNAVFEHSHLIHAFRFETPLRMGPVWDTQIAEYDLAQGRIINPDGTYSVPQQGIKPHMKLSLGDTVLRRFGVEMDKDVAVRTSFRKGTSLTPRQLNYAAFDAIYASRLAKVQRTEMERVPGLLNLFRIDCNHTEAVARMVLNGMPFDVDYCAALEAEWTNDIEMLKEGIRAALYEAGDGEPVLTTTGRVKMTKGEVVIQDVPFNSNDKMVERLNNAGIPATSYKSEDLKNFRQDSPVIDAIIEYKRLTKLLSTYVSSLPGHVNPGTGRIHCDYKVTSTTTGRASVERPALQQIPSRSAQGRRIRECFRVRPGKKLVIADYSNIELRLVAEYFGDQTMTRAFQDGLDLHLLTAAMMHFNLSDTSWGILLPAYQKAEALMHAKDPVLLKARQDAKALNFGLAYGAGAQKLQELAWKDYDLRWTLDEAAAKRTMWMSLYAGVAGYHREMGKRLKVAGEEGLLVSTAEGRGRWVTGYSEALNHRIQGTSGDMLKRAQILLTHEMPLLLGVHDELIAEVDEDDAEICAAVMQDRMVESGQRYLTQVPVVVEVKIEESWKK